MLKLFSTFIIALALISCKCNRKSCEMERLAESQAYKDCQDGLNKGKGLVDAQGNVYVIDRVYFGFDRYNLTDAARKTLDEQSVLLRDKPDMKAVITGHCDYRGGREYNIALGAKRANAAKDYLETRGISSSRFEVISKGKDDPVVLGSTPEACAQNRVAILS